MKRKAVYEQPSITLIKNLGDVILASALDLVRDIWYDENDTELY